MTLFGFGDKTLLGFGWLGFGDLAGIRVWWNCVALLLLLLFCEWCSLGGSWEREWAGEPMAGEGAQVPAVVSAAAGGQQQQQQAPSMTHSSASGLPATLGPMSAASAGTSAAAAAASQLQQQQQLSYQMQQFNQNQAKTQQQQQAARVQYAQSSQLQVPASQQLMAPTQVAGNPLSRSGSGQRLSHMPQQQQQHYNTQFLSSSSVATSGVSSQTMLMAQQRAAAAGQAQLQQQQRPSSVLQPVQSRPGIYGLQQQQPQQQLAPGSYAHHLNPAQSPGGVVARPAAVQQGTPQYGVQSQLSLPQQHAMQVCYFLLVAPFVCMWAFHTESGTTNFNWVERVCTGFAGKAEASSRADATTHSFPDNCTITCTAGYGHG